MIYIQYIGLTLRVTKSDKQLIFLQTTGMNFLQAEKRESIIGRGGAVFSAPLDNPSLNEI